MNREQAAARKLDGGTLCGKQGAGKTTGANRRVGAVDCALGIVVVLLRTLLRRVSDGEPPECNPRLCKTNTTILASHSGPDTGVAVYKQFAPGKRGQEAGGSAGIAHKILRVGVVKASHPLAAMCTSIGASTSSQPAPARAAGWGKGGASGSPHGPHACLASHFIQNCLLSHASTAAATRLHTICP